MAIIVLLDNDCSFLEVMVRKLRRRKFLVEPICVQKPQEFFMETAEFLYGPDTGKGVVLISNYHLSRDIKGNELIRYAQDVAQHLGLGAIKYGIISNDHKIHSLLELSSIPAMRKDAGLGDLIKFVKDLAAKQGTELRY